MSAIISKRTSEISAFLLNWLIRVFNKYPVVLEDQHDPRPIGPHVTLKFLTGFTRVGLDDEILVNPQTGARTMRGFREFSVSIKAVGSPLDGSKPNSFLRATDILAGIHWELEKPANRYLFSDAGLGIVETTPILDTTDFEENVFIPRAVMDMRLSTQIIENIPTTFIETVKIGGNVDNQDLSTLTVSKP